MCSAGEPCLARSLYPLIHSFVQEQQGQWPAVASLEWGPTRPKHRSTCCTYVLCHLIFLSKHSHEVGTVINPNLQMRTLRSREVE